MMEYHDRPDISETAIEQIASHLQPGETAPCLPLAFDEYHEGSIYQVAMIAADRSIQWRRAQITKSRPVEGKPGQWDIEATVLPPQDSN